VSTVERLRQRFVEEGLAAVLSPYRDGRRIYEHKLDEPLPVRPGAVERYDHVYTRDGAASLFLASEPLVGWRYVAVTEHRRRGNWTGFMRDLLDGRYRDAEHVVLVMDQLNTHSLASLYEAFPLEHPKRLAGRIELHHTPVHGSWLNMAAIELSALGRQCLDRRIAKSETLRRHVAPWEDQRNNAKAKINWHFTIDQARNKLRNLYPS
jgi:hypothetical protein